MPGHHDSCPDTRIRKAEVKACYIRMKRRWIRVGTLCLHRGEFVSEVSQPLPLNPIVIVRSEATRQSR